MLKSGLFRAGTSLTVVGAFVLTACHDPSGLRVLDGVSAEAHYQQVVVANNSATAIFTIVIGRNAQARVDWIPCVDAVRCPPIAPGQSQMRPYGSVTLDPGEKEIVVHWWHAVPDGSGGTRAGDFQSLIVPLQ
jgi:hypothetical protein